MLWHVLYVKWLRTVIDKQKDLFIVSFVSCLSFSEEHALDLYSMKKFCSDKMVKLMTPSQKRQGSFVNFLFPLVPVAFHLEAYWGVGAVIAVGHSAVCHEWRLHTGTHMRGNPPMQSGRPDIIPTSFFCEISSFYTLVFSFLHHTERNRLSPLMHVQTEQEFLFFPLMFSALSFSFPYVLPSLLTVETLFGRWVIVKLWKWQHKYSALICCWNNTKKLFLETL